MEATENQLSNKLHHVPVIEIFKDLPFEYDSSDEDGPRIDGNIFRVKGKRAPWKNLRAVMKTISLKNDTNLDASMRTCRKEARIMHAARHVHAIRFYTAYFHKPKTGPMNFNIVMDRAGNGDLSSRISSSPSSSLQERWIGCLIRSVAHVHQLGIRHRDIKPPNILINTDKDVLLADFGTSHMSLGNTVPTTMPGWSKGRTVTHCAPEVNEAQGRSRGRSADIFSLGAVILEMLLSHSYKKDYLDLVKEIEYVPPKTRDPVRSFAENLQKVHRILEDFKTQKRKTIAPWHSEVFDLCRDMLEADRDVRPSAKMAEDRWDSLVLLADGTNGTATNRQLSCDTCASSIPDKTKTDELLEACGAGISQKIDTLLLLPGQDRPSPNTEGAMHQAAMVGSDASIRVLVSRGADVNTIDYAGQTALHYAAANGKDRAARQLLGYDGIDVAAVDLEGQTPLHCAAAHGSVDVIRLLLAALDGAKSKNGSSAGGKGRDHDHINALDDDELTPLHYAARRGRLGAVKLLLERGANSEARDKHYGYLAVDFAHKRGFPEVEKVLADWGRKKRGK